MQHTIDPHRQWMTTTLVMGLCALLPWLGGCRDDQGGHAEVSGAVAAGVVSGAAVASFAVANGQVAETPFATAVTDTAGRYRLSVPETGPFVVEARGGGYQDAATGASRALEIPLRSAATTVQSPLNITPFSEAAVRHAARRNDWSEASIKQGRRLATHYLLGVDPLTTMPLDPANAQAMATASDLETVLAVALGTLSQEVADRSGATLETVVEQITDGMATGGTWLASHGGGYVEDQSHPNRLPTNRFPPDVGEGFVPAFGHFVSGDRNASGVHHADHLIFASARIQGGSCDSTLTGDFASRDALPESTAPDWQTTATAGTWGPRAAPLPVVNVPTVCDALSWRQQRVLAVIDKYVNLDLNYCHHHIPGWLPPDDSDQPHPKFRVSTGENMTCTANRTDASGNIVWQGVDCSDFTSWVYNYAFGIPAGGAVMPTGIGQQACDLGVAPGVALDYNRTNIAEVIAAGKLQPGDLLYIMGGGTSVQITHVILWTGQQVGVNFDQSRLAPDAASYVGSGQSLEGAWVIADSHYAGPAYRPFLGWYQASISHVRRVIGASQAPASDVLDITDPTKFNFIQPNTCSRVGF